MHVHNPTSLQYAVLSKLVSRAAIIVTIHGDQDTHARLGSPLEWKLTSAAVIVSHAAGKTLRLPGQAGPFVVVNNGVAAVIADDTERADTRAALGAGDSCVGIIVARIDGKKGHGTLLKSLKTLDHHPGLTMWIVGDGPARAAAEAEAARLGLGHDRVRFLGRRSDIDRLLEGADFFVLPSDIEGIPMSILEAMAHGLPIIASHVGGIPEIIEHDINGLLVPAGDDRALASVIQRVAADPAFRRRLGHAARERANTTFSLSTMMRKYDQGVRRSAGRQDNSTLMRALLFTHLFPSRYEPTRGVYNLRGFGALAGFCDVELVVPVAFWRRVRRPRDWGRRVVERHNGLSASYPTFWNLPRIGMQAHPEAMYRSPPEDASTS